MYYETFLSFVITYPSDDQFDDRWAGIFLAHSSKFISRQLSWYFRTGIAIQLFFDYGK